MSSKGQLTIPEDIRAQAKVRCGDQLDVGCAAGLIVLRKREPLTRDRRKQLLRPARALPEFDTAASAEVEATIARVRKRGRA